jgi:hypothetical protein
MKKALAALVAFIGLHPLPGCRPHHPPVITSLTGTSPLADAPWPRAFHDLRDACRRGGR